MTTDNNMEDEKTCPAEVLVKMLSGKWKLQILRLAFLGPIRFNSLLRELVGSNKQSIALALKELEEQGFLEKATIKLKPLHIEYNLSEKSKSLVPVFRQLEIIS